MEEERRGRSRIERKIDKKKRRMGEEGMRRMGEEWKIDLKRIVGKDWERKNRRGEGRERE